ncbi:hypothetical protein [Empedobacter sp. UBA7620]|uniref:hypothetical protein n=1 Tax=Empedobacter sp. UBA7620 TaxID=1946452 RepID=UPI0025BF5DCB|nr:hypothetical protein [Empedobacter sp. UBA7620]
MKKLLFTFLLTLFTSVQLFADGPFLYSLPFGSRAYLDDTILEKTKEKGIDYSTFEKYLLDNNIELGKKVGLLSELEVYFVLNDNQKSYFVDYKEKFKKSVGKKFGTKTPLNERFLIALMDDCDTESPKVEVYQKFVDENPQSKTMQFVNVFAYNFNLIWDIDKKDYSSMNDFKEKYQDNCLQNFESFNNDTSADIFSELEEIITLGYNCDYALKYLAPANNRLDVLNQKTEFILNKIANAEPIPRMVVTQNASQIGLSAYEWLGEEMKLISSLKISDEEKTLVNYFAVNETYNYINHVNNLYVLFEAIQKTPSQLAKSANNKSVEKIAAKDDWKKINQLYDVLKKNFQKDNEIAVGSSSNLDDLRNLIYYLYLNPKELSKVYQN